MARDAGQGSGQRDGVLASRVDINPLWQLVFATGFLGGDTTFSSYTWEALSPAQTGAWHGQPRTWWVAICSDWWESVLEPLWRRCFRVMEGKMNIVGTGKRVRIYMGEHDTAAGHPEPLWETILELLREEGAAGATMTRGLAGFGAHSKLHLARLADLTPDLPVLIEWIDGPERVDRLLPRVAELVTTGMITIDEVEIVKYTHRTPRPMPPDRVREVMTRDVMAVHADTPLGEIVRLLLDRDFRAVPVVDAQNQLVGIITNGDLVERGGLSARMELLKALESPALERELAASAALERTAADMMTPEPTHVAADEQLARAAHLMAEHRIKRLPVVDDAGQLVGMLSRVDVLRTIGEDYHGPAAHEAHTRGGPVHVVGDIMRTDVPSVAAEASLGEVLDAVTSTRLNRAIVVNRDQHVLGIISDQDLLARLDPGAETGLMAALMRRGRLSSPEAKTVAREVMHGPVVAVPMDAPVSEAVQRMLEARRKVLPIIDADGRLAGVVDRADLLGALRSGDERPRRDRARQ